MDNRKPWGVGISGRGQDIRKVCRRVNMAEILCIHVCNGKMRPAETIPGMGGRGKKENDEESEFKYKNFCKCPKCIPSTTIFLKKAKREKCLLSSFEHF
jgi:hypothetical protein